MRGKFDFCLESDLRGQGDNYWGLAASSIVDFKSFISSILKKNTLILHYTSSFIHFLKDQFGPAVIKILGRQINSPSAKPYLTCCGYGKSLKIELSFSPA